MASVATKRRAENKSYKIKYKALKELEKGTPHKDVASFFAMMRSLKELNFNVEKEYVFNKKQTLISDFFLSNRW